jgi:predicted esterase
MTPPDDPHVYGRGPAPSTARLTMILVHGRGASAADILSLADELGTTDVAFVAPEAPGHTWYPYSFLSPIPQNEPGISSGLSVLAGIVKSLNQQGITTDRIGLLGFSQGACLSLEFGARNARRYAAIIGLSGGLIGPPGTPRDYTGSMEGTPVFLGCSDIDAHIPLERVHESAAVFRRLGATVDERIFPGMGHTITAEEIGAVKALLSGHP